MRPKKTYYGVTIGILMVKTEFQRFLGDIGNAQTWDFPVQYKIVTEATPEKIVDIHNVSLLEPFKKAADELIAAGCDGIATTCGFLSLYQKDLADHCSVPVAASSLLQIPMVERILPTGKRVGILTYNGDVLKGAYLETVGVATDTPVEGMPPSSNFVRWIKHGDTSVTYETLRGEVVAAAKSLVARNPQVGAIVLECTNLAPFSYDIAQATGLMVYDTVTLVNSFHAALKPRDYTRM